MLMQSVERAFVYTLIWQCKSLESYKYCTDIFLTKPEVLTASPGAQNDIQYVTGHTFYCMGKTKNAAIFSVDRHTFKQITDFNVYILHTHTHTNIQCVTLSPHLSFP